MLATRGASNTDQSFNKQNPHTYMSIPERGSSLVLFSVALSLLTMFQRKQSTRAPKPNDPNPLTTSPESSFRKFTGCLSFTLVKREGIEHVFGFDRYFSTAKFSL